MPPGTTDTLRASEHSGSGSRLFNRDRAVAGARPLERGPHRTPGRGPGGTPRRRKEDRDQLARFQRPLVWFRWLVVSLSLSTALLSGSVHTNRFALVALVMWTGIRSLEPVRTNGPKLRTLVPLVVEFAVSAGIVSATGGWSSSNALILLPPLVVIACVSGTSSAMTLSLACGAIVTSTMANDGVLQTTALEDGVRWTGTLLLVSLLVGTGFRLITEATNSQQMTSQRMQQLHEANTLLYDLQRVARRLPSSLDLGEVLRATASEFAATSGLTRISVLLVDDDGDRWSVAETFGCSMPMSFHTTELPVSLRAAINARTVMTVDSGAEGLLGTNHPGDFAVGVYAPLLARDQLIGVIVGETYISDRATADGAANSSIEEVARQLSGPAAVAIDNARWFGRIRSVAADDERVRIARDLHDRIGQSLALLGFEVDRIARTTDDSAVRTELFGLRSQVTEATREVREALYDLRTDVTTEEGIAEVLQTFLERVTSRSGIKTTLSATGTAVLPLRISRELWHIAQEAIVNAERHARPSTINVRWCADGAAAELDIDDDGVGFAAGAGRADSYGLRGLRERAAGIGANVEVKSAVGQGTTVKVRLNDAL